VRRLLRLSFGRRAVRDALDDEIALHIALRIEQLVALGMSPEAARVEALRRFSGSVEEFEHVRHRLQHSAERREDRMRIHEWLGEIAKDVRYAWRSLRRQPGFAAAAILTLALGIGANTAMFGVVDAVLLRPLPYGQPDRLVMVWNHWTGWPQTWLSAPEVTDYAAQHEIFSKLSAFNTGAVNLTGGGEPERVRTGYIPADFLATMGVTPLIGRAFTEQEDLPNGPHAALLDYALWQRRFAGDRGVIGKTIEVSAQSYTVVGVLPLDFRLPNEFAGEHAQLYMPLQLGPVDENERGSHGLLAVGRLQPGVAITAAQTRANGFIEQLKKDHPNNYNADFGVTLVPMSQEVLGGSRLVLLTLLAAVAFVLVIGCANVANLLLSRAEARHREIAIRAALGAGRRRLARQFLTESVFLGLAGGAIGLPLAAWGGPLLVRFGSSNLPRADQTALDVRVMLFAVGLTLLTSIVFGLAPVMHALNGDLQQSLRPGRGTSGGAGGLRLRHLLVTAQVALAVVSVAGAALMARSLKTLLDVPPGFQTERVLTMRLSLPSAKYGRVSSVQDFYMQARERIGALPGVKSVGAISALPLTGTIGDWSLQIQGAPPTPPNEQGPAADWQVATPGYFEAMQIPVRQGRFFTDGDRRGAQPVIVISETMARRYWPKESALGRRVRLGGSADSLWREVVGIVGDVRHKALDQEIRPEFYLPHAQFPSTLPDSGGGAQNAMTLVIRTVAEPTAMTNTVRGTLAAMDRMLPVASVRTLDDVVASSVATPRLATLLLSTFGLLALLLSAIGVYSVMSYSVARRTSEIGIRMALGAETSAVLRLIVRQGMWPAVVGAALGIAAVLAGSRVMRGMLYGVSATDPLSLVAALVLLLAVALAATLLPALRVTRVDPTAALRAD
jgi:putative ABC transport system permease protein